MEFLAFDSWRREEQEEEEETLNRHHSPLSSSVTSCYRDTSRSFVGLVAADQKEQTQEPAEDEPSFVLPQLFAAKCGYGLQKPK